MIAFEKQRNSLDQSRGHLLSDMANLVPCSTHPVSVNRKKKEIHSILFMFDLV